MRCAKVDWEKGRGKEFRGDLQVLIERRVEIGRIDFVFRRRWVVDIVQHLLSKNPSSSYIHFACAIVYVFRVQLSFHLSLPFANRPCVFACF